MNVTEGGLRGGDGSNRGDDGGELGRRLGPVPSPRVADGDDGGDGNDGGDGGGGGGWNSGGVTKILAGG